MTPRNKVLVIAAALFFGPVMTILVRLDSGVDAQEDVGGEARIGLADWAPEGEAARGQKVYEQWCIGCHGVSGRGDGTAADWLDPLPRNFQAGRFKFRSTPNGAPPLVDDIVKTVTCGLPGSSMPGFPLLPEVDRRDVAKYVLHLMALGTVNKEVRYLVEEEGESLDSIRANQLDELKADALASMERAAKPMSMPAEPPVTAESLALGREIYVENCGACHGDDGRGFGPSSFTMRDWKDTTVLPRDFTTGVFRAGGSARDVFLRMRTGVTGTPMPSIDRSDEELWALTHYVLSFSEGRDEIPHPTQGCGGAR